MGLSLVEKSDHMTEGEQNWMRTGLCWILKRSLWTRDVLVDLGHWALKWLGVGGSTRGSRV